MTCQTEPCRTAAGTAPFRAKSDDEQFVMLLRELIDPAYRCGIFSRKSKKPISIRSMCRSRNSKSRCCRKWARNPGSPCFRYECRKLSQRQRAAQGNKSTERPEKINLLLTCRDHCEFSRGEKYPGADHVPDNDRKDRGETQFFPVT